MRTDDRPATLYRLFKDNELLYIGISATVIHRLNNHRQQKPWFLEVNQITVEHYETRTEALAAEEEAIKNERPRYNIIHNPSVPQLDQRNSLRLSEFNKQNEIDFEEEEESSEDEDEFGIYKGAFVLTPIFYNVTLHIQTELSAWNSFLKTQGNDEWFFSILRCNPGTSSIYIHYDALEIGTMIETAVCVDSLIFDLKPFIQKFEESCGEGVMSLSIERTETTFDFDNSVEVNKGHITNEELID